MQDLVLTFEIKIDGSVRDPCNARDISHFRIEVPLFRKDLYTGTQDRLAFVGHKLFVNLSGSSH
jgi:hypothetical protein